MQYADGLQPSAFSYRKQLQADIKAGQCPWETTEGRREGREGAG